MNELSYALAKVAAIGDFPTPVGAQMTNFLYPDFICSSINWKISF